MPPQILLVEDNRAEARLLIEALDEAGVRAEVVHLLDAGEAFAALVAAAESGARLPDVVVTNLNLPSMRGDRFLRLIRARLDIAHLPVLVLTTSDDAADRHRCRAADVYCLKGEGWDDAVDAANRIGEVIRASRARRGAR